MRPLDGIRVVDLTRVLSGPYCTMILADLGADVIKVEPPTGDDTRGWGPPFVGGESTYFLSTNRSKRSIVLDLKAERDKQALWDLIATADVLAENFRPGTLARLGFGWDELRVRNPRLVLVSLSGYGQTGPLAGLAGYDLIAQGEGGLMGVTGEPGRPPVKAGFAVADLGSGMWAVIGVLAALRARDVTGVGDHVDVSLLGTMVAWQTYQGQAYLSAGRISGPLGSAHPSIVPYQTFPGSDGYFNLAVGNDGQWDKLCDILERRTEGDRWYRDVSLATNAGRVERREAVVRGLSALFQTEPCAEWMREFLRAGIPAGKVANVAEVFENPQVQAQHLVQTAPHPTAGDLPLVRTPITFANGELRPPQAPPLFGADTEDVLARLRPPVDQRQDPPQAPDANQPD
jgi:crotonobetainyl-CoA:carnitine CoA-transferase CaiB-like acyl-CoA transferase